MNIDFVCGHIPRVMNAMYDEQCLNAMTLSEIRDAFRTGQMISKQWLLDEIRPYLNRTSRVGILGSWFGFTALCLFSMGFPNIVDIDIDPKTEYFAKKLNSHNQYYSRITSDALLEKLDTYDLIINTSAEHMDNSWLDNVPDHAIIAIQSNNLDIVSHNNICSNLKDFRAKYNLDYFYCDKKEFPQHERYMGIGHKKV